MKKFIGFAVTALIMGALLVGCGGDETETYYEASSNVEVNDGNDVATGDTPSIGSTDIATGSVAGLLDLRAFGELMDSAVVELMFADSLAVFELVAERIETLSDELTAELYDEATAIVEAAMELFDVSGLITENEMAVVMGEFMFAAEILEDEMVWLLDEIPHDFVPNEDAITELVMYLQMQGLDIWEVLEVIDYISWQEDHELYYEALIVMVMVETVFELVPYAEYLFGGSMAVLESVAERVELMGDQALILLDQISELGDRAMELFSSFELITDEELDIILAELEAFMEYFEEDFLAELEAMMELFEDMLYFAVMDAMMMFDGLGDFDLGGMDLSDFDLSGFDLGDFDLGAFDLDAFGLGDFDLSNFDLSGLEDLLASELNEIIQNLDVSSLLSQFLWGN